MKKGKKRKITNQIKQMTPIQNQNPMTEFLRKLARTKNDFRNLLALIFTFGLIAFVFVLIRRAIPAENRDVMYIIAGSLIGNVNQIIQFFFGSSKGEVERVKKTEEAKES
jgi:hypothetical protein